MSPHPGAARFAFTPLLYVFLSASVVAPGQLSAQADSGAVGRTIARIAALAREADPTLRAARARELAVERLVASAGSAPPLSAALGLSDGPRGDVLRGNASIEVGRGLFLGSRLLAARTAASRELAIELRERRVAEEVIEVRVTDLVTNGVAAQRALTRLRQSEQLLADAEEALASRLAAGTGRYADVLRVRTERLAVGFSIRDELANLASVRLQLRATAGASLHADSLDRWLAEAATATTPASAWRSTLSDPVRDAAAVRARAEARRALGIASRRPDVNGAIGLQRIGAANGGPTAGLLVGISSTLPFSARRANERATQAEDADVIAAEAGVSAAMVRSRPGLEGLRERLTVTVERLEAIDAVVLVAAGSEREAALAEFRAGSLSLLELLDFERSLLRVELERSDALREAAGLRAALFGITPFEFGVRP
jgi:outer membrane protein TolC